MSAGPFLLSKYETDDGDILPIRIQPETLTVADNAEPAGGADGPFVKVSGSKRSYGVHPRKLTLSRSVGSADYGSAKAYARVVMLTSAAYDAAVIGSTVTYAGVDWVIASKTNESVR
jgi:hypothetical protein